MQEQRSSATASKQREGRSSISLPRFSTIPMADSDKAIHKPHLIAQGGIEHQMSAILPQCFLAQRLD
ncbi:hypothetical protein AWC35_07455 [Gibbsiella quercinecans]|uniref:Uncharacterized protein n=1 Tax=Gibbsiella quercinecans TaxID=929813 RepID=A0A250AZ56_9GAMM|nr:hypothetical protein AWC35_07455 [Gibbsiella quercinecans]RLM06308.1 hypothetical protein BIY31_15525 [Gibbsiella quercinecans]RLM11018.1 hypothetical protein BIY30_08660 [Gibbsiella quercinecans]